METHITSGLFCLALDQLTLCEPATLITDYLMAGIAVWFYLRLKQGDRKQQLWAVAFLWLGIGAFLGGTWHGFQAHLHIYGSLILWSSCLLAALYASYQLWQASDGSKHLGLAKLILASLLALYMQAFLIVLLDFVVTACLLLHYALKRRQHYPLQSRFILASIFTFIVGGSIQHFKLSPVFWFNHNDLFHVVQLIGNFLLYVSVRQIQATDSLLGTEGG